MEQGYLSQVVGMICQTSLCINVSHKFLSRLKICMYFVELYNEVSVTLFHWSPSHVFFLSNKSLKTLSCAGHHLRCRGSSQVKFLFIYSWLQWWIPPWRALQILCHVWSMSGILLHFPKSNFSDVLPNWSKERKTLLMAAVTQVNFQPGIQHSHLLVISSLAKHSTQLSGNFLVHLIPLICSSLFKDGKMQVMFCP